MVGLYETLENILRKETDFAVKGKFKRVVKIEAEITWTWFEVVSKD